MLAITRHVIGATAARPARTEAEGNAVAGPHFRHGGPDLDHFARALVPQHRWRSDRDELVAGDEVGVAQADARNADENLVGARFVQFDLAPAEFGNILTRDRSLALHRSYLFMIAAPASIWAGHRNFVEKEMPKVRGIPVKRI